MSKDTLPCPFCGDTPEFENTDERARLRCTGCGTEGGVFFFSQEECESGDGAETEARAIEAWNCRASFMDAPAVPVQDALRAWHDEADRLKKCVDYAPNELARMEFASQLVRHLCATQAAPAALPPDWRAVPVEPTLEMMSAVDDAYEGGGDFSDMWEAALASSPTPPLSAADGGPSNG